MANTIITLIGGSLTIENLSKKLTMGSQYGILKHISVNCNAEYYGKEITGTPEEIFSKKDSLFNKFKKYHIAGLKKVIVYNKFLDNILYTIAIKLEFFNRESATIGKPPDRSTENPILEKEFVNSNTQSEINRLDLVTINNEFIFIANVHFGPVELSPPKPSDIVKNCAIQNDLFLTRKIKVFIQKQEQKEQERKKILIDKDAKTDMVSIAFEPGELGRDGKNETPKYKNKSKEIAALSKTINEEIEEIEIKIGNFVKYKQNLIEFFKNTYPSLFAEGTTTFAAMPYYQKDQGSPSIQQKQQQHQLNSQTGDGQGTHVVQQSGSQVNGLAVDLASSSNIGAVDSGREGAPPKKDEDEILDDDEEEDEEEDEEHLDSADEVDEDLSDDDDDVQTLNLLNQGGPKVLNSVEQTGQGQSRLDTNQAALNGITNDPGESRKLGGQHQSQTPLGSDNTEFPPCPSCPPCPTRSPSIVYIRALISPTLTKLRDCIYSKYLLFILLIIFAILIFYYI
uniref:Uncharacterized protein n=1 Tax=viral metagenome TaxID=1070528 RepID=A0A6C0JB84_9ZZZZ